MCGGWLVTWGARSCSSSVRRQARAQECARQRDLDGELQPSSAARTCVALIGCHGLAGSKRKSPSCRTVTSLQTREHGSGSGSSACLVGPPSPCRFDWSTGKRYRQTVFSLVSRQFRGACAVQVATHAGRQGSRPLLPAAAVGSVTVSSGRRGGGCGRRFLPQLIEDSSHAPIKSPA